MGLGGAQSPRQNPGGRSGWRPQKISLLMPRKWKEIIAKKEWSFSLTLHYECNTHVYSNIESLTLLSFMYTDMFTDINLFHIIKKTNLKHLWWSIVLLNEKITKNVFFSFYKKRLKI